MQRIERSNGFFRERLTGAFNNLRGNSQDIPTQSRCPKMSFTIRGSRFRDGAHGLSAMQDAITLNQRQIGTDNGIGICQNLTHLLTGILTQKPGQYGAGFGI